MSALSIQPTYPIFTDIDGQPLEAGYVWIGQENLDPQVNPINVYWDAALTIAARQPVRTLGGYPSRNGTPARLYVNSDYSIRVMNRNGSVVYSSSTATERYSGVVISGDIAATQIQFVQSGSGAVTRDIQTDLREVRISVTQYGADVSNTAEQNDTAFADACSEIMAQGGGTLVIPPGEYEVCHQVFGSGSAAWLNTDAIVISGCAKHITIEGYGAKLKMPNGQRWGSFDPVTGAPFYPSSFPFFNGLYAGHPGYFINIQNNSGGVTIKGLELDGNCANYIVGGEYGDIGYQVRADGIISTNNASLNVSDMYIHNCGRDGIDVFDNASTESSTVRPVYIENVDRKSVV
jgi:hypothetical protein